MYYMSSLILDLVLVAACLCLTARATNYHPEIFPDYFEESEKLGPLDSNFYEPDRPLHDLWQTMPKAATKRALSILTRWKSLSGDVGRRTNTLSKSPRAPMSLMQGDFDSKEMPGRRVGAPLRWG